MSRANKKGFIFVAICLAFLCILVDLVLAFNGAFIGADTLKMHKATRIFAILLVLIAVILLIMAYSPHFFWRKKGAKNRLSFSFKGAYSDKLVLAILAMVLLLSAINQKIISNDYFGANLALEQPKDNEIVQNPFWSEYEKASKDFGLDLSFAKDLVQKRYADYRQNPLFADEPKSVDVLIFGDSTVAWGIIPEVLAQISSKKVRLFAYEGFGLTLESIKILKDLANYYLKDDGILIFSYNHGAIGLNIKPNIISLNEATKEQIMQAKAFFDNIKNGGIIKRAELKQKDNDSLEEKLKKLGFGLHSPDLYTKYIEPDVNKQWHTNKFEKFQTILSMQNGASMILYGTKITLMHPSPKNFTKLRLENSGIDTSNFNINSKALNAFSKYKRFFALGPYFGDAIYSFEYEVYKRYFKPKGFGLMNVDKYMQDNLGLQTNFPYHTINTGSLYKSIIYAMWIKEYFEKLK